MLSFKLRSVKHLNCNHDNLRFCQKSVGTRGALLLVARPAGREGSVKFREQGDLGKFLIW